MSVLRVTILEMRDCERLLIFASSTCVSVWSLMKLRSSSAKVVASCPESIIWHFVKRHRETGKDEEDKEVIGMAEVIIGRIENIEEKQAANGGGYLVVDLEGQEKGFLD